MPKTEAKVTSSVPDGIDANLYFDATQPAEERAAHVAHRVSQFRIFIETEHPAVPIFSSWTEVPDGLATRNQWDDENRRVSPKSNPSGILIWWDVRPIRDAEGRATTLLDVCCRHALLFGVDQTSPFTPTPLQRAHRAFYNTFVRLGGRERYGWWDEDAGHWKSCKGRLSKEQTRKHVYGSEVYGVYGGDATRFAAIDLDLHGGDQHVFLDQLEVLLRHFGLKNGWHLQVADANANGVHLLTTLPSTPIHVVRSDLQSELHFLDLKHADLRRRAESCGMTTLAKLELFPNEAQLFRLPLCRGRTMLLNEPLRLIPNKRTKHNMVQDIVGYINWLQKVNIPHHETKNR